MDSLQRTFKDPSWNRQEKQALHDAWHERYRQAPPSMSPEHRPDGFLRDSQGRPDQAFYSLEHEFRAGIKTLKADREPGYEVTNDDVLKTKSAVEQTYRERQGRLDQQLRYGAQGPDMERLRAQKEAEQDSYHHFQAWMDNGGQNNAPAVTRARERAQDSFGHLVDYDRRQGHPIADRERDLVQDPPSINEQRHWCTREAEGLHQVQPGARRETREEARHWHLDHYQREEPTYASGIVPNALQHQVDQRHAAEHTAAQAHTKAQIGAHRIAPGEPGQTSSSGERGRSSGGGAHEAGGAIGPASPGAPDAATPTPTFNMGLVKDRMAAMRAKAQQAPDAPGTLPATPQTPGALASPTPGGPRAVPPQSPSLASQNEHEPSRTPTPPTVNTPNPGGPRAPQASAPPVPPPSPPPNGPALPPASPGGPRSPQQAPQPSAEPAAPTNGQDLRGTLSTSPSPTPPASRPKGFDR